MVKIGILGNKNKTITIDILAQLCKASGMKVSTIKNINLNNCLKINKNFFSNYIEELNKNSVDMVIIKLTEEGLKRDWFSSINFDVIIYTVTRNEKKYKLFYPIERKIFYNVSKNGVIIINSDDRKIFKLLKGNKTRLITYGFNSKASVTASSIQQEEKDRRIQCCVQRTIITFSGKKLEPQEFSITLPLNQDDELYGALGAITAAIINDVNISINKIL
ncbi:Mur ligase family protein [Defluviitalea phaphyphila]|uniref:Mur ligase family protein n=1 Tax=Defluviitalea phaphyphila TaxID=1473580 RepID=UPI000731B784|nr:Mur ligase family protein [Defluviitalea phaphyphila]